jgi:polar amino acid transport system substrate-binding protein
MKLEKCIILLLIYFSVEVNAQDVHIGLEPFPPIVNEDGQGYAIDMFKAIEVISDLKFHFHIMNYARAKKELQKQSLDMIGLTPQGYETKDFYQYSEDINWSVTAKVDLFTLEKKYFNIQLLPKQSIGTLRGNADFFSELLNIPRDKFIEISSLTQLTKMLQRKRLKIITFERASTMTTIKKLDISGVYYKKVAEIPASFAVYKNNKGLKLKAKIDRLLSQVKSKSYFLSYFKYQKLTDTGLITPKK